MYTQKRLFAWHIKAIVLREIRRNYKKYSLINTLCFLQSICGLCLIYRELKVTFSRRKASISNLVKSCEERCDVKRATNSYERLLFCFRNDLVKGVVFGMFVEFTPLQLNHRISCRISQIRHLKWKKYRPFLCGSLRKKMGWKRGLGTGITFGVLPCPTVAFSVG